MSQLMKTSRPPARAFSGARGAAHVSAVLPKAVVALASSKRASPPPCSTPTFSSFVPSSIVSQRSLEVVTRASATESQAASASTSQTKEWYALVANAEFFLNDVQNESIAEQLRERVRFFKETNRPVDFFIVPEPTWLEAKYPEQAKQVKRPCVALVSTDKVWITFMKLRLDRVLRIDLGSVPDSEALSVGGQLPNFTPPSKWTAPYGRYSSGWWDVFVPKQQH